MCVCGLELPILADWLSLSNLKSEQRDVSRRVAKIRAQLPTKKKSSTKIPVFFSCVCVSANHKAKANEIPGEGEREQLI